MTLKLLILLILCFCVVVVVRGTIQLRAGEYRVQEQDEEVDVYVESVPPSDEVIWFRCKLSDDAKDDFVSTIQLGKFEPGETTSKCQFDVVNDPLPEGFETFPLSLDVKVGPKDVVPQNATITILPSDDPFGCVGFIPAAISKTVKEPEAPGEERFVPFKLYRYGGSVGRLVLQWKILQDNTDVSPTGGLVEFVAGQTKQSIVIEILLDSYPETEEIFTIALKNISGGGCIMSNSSEVELRIQENDAPVQFALTQKTVSEASVVKLPVFRGIDLNGDRIGSISAPATVSYTTISQTAIPGKDYTELLDKVLTFESGITRKDIEIQVLSDPFPELREQFLVRIYNVSQGFVLLNSTEVLVEITKNDDPHGVLSFHQTSVVMNEDSASSKAQIIVNRTRGTFGNVTAEWKLSGVFIEKKFLSTSGTVEFAQGESAKSFTVELKKNKIPEEADSFEVKLSSVTGGARFAKPDPTLQLFVADSDNAYGMITFAHSSPRFLLAETPRRLSIPLVRSGGLLADVEVTLSVKYFDDDIPSTDQITVLMSNGQATADALHDVRNDVFLSAGSYFVITLNDVTLKKTTLVTASSPTLNSSRKQRVNVTSNYANSEIGFHSTPLHIQVEEPATGTTQVDLLIMRDGTAMPANVSWNVASSNPLFTSGDVDKLNGYVLINPGVDRVTLSVSVNADDLPELEEEFDITLTSVTGRNERLRTGATKAKVTILQNDSPGGEFGFKNMTHIYIEESSVNVVTIERKGGTLLKQRVLVEIINGERKFAPYQQLLKFAIGESEKNFYLAPIDDEIPELSQTFSIMLRSVDGSVIVHRQRNVTIVPNDHPYGLLALANYTENIRQTVREKKAERTAVEFDITRNKGLFGEVRLFWNVVNGGEDVTPSHGELKIGEGEAKAKITLYITQDQIPEGDETFLLNLTQVEGGATLVEPRTAQVVILRNDFPVTLTPRNVTVVEGQTVNVTVHLSHQVGEHVRVEIQTTGITATKSVDYILLTNTVVFVPFEQQKVVSILTVDDLLPELNETFVVSLLSVTGADTVLRDNISTQVTILANDDSYGVFEFYDTNHRTIKEGASITLRVERMRGSFGNATIHWSVKLLENSTNDLLHTNGSVFFEEGKTSEYITIQTVEDDMPEMQEMFIVRLDSTTQGKIGLKDEIPITIASSDHPNGIFWLNSNLSIDTLAEDAKDGYPTQGEFVVQRSKGSFYSAQVVWEISQIASWDLLVNAERDLNFSRVKGRDNSSTPAFKLSKDKCVVTKMKYYPSWLEGGFTVGLWMKSSGNSSMFSLLSKTSQDGVRDMDISLDISQKYNTDDSDKKIDLADGNWHSVFIVVNPNFITTYMDDHFVFNSSDVGSTLSTTDTLSVGCGNAQPFTGYVQDVQLYHQLFTQKNLPSRLSWFPAHFKPSGGVIDFAVNETQKRVTLQTTDDTEAQPDTLYTARIVDVIDGLTGQDHSEVDMSRSHHQVNVIQSDFANGIFLLNQTNCPAILREPTDDLLMRIERTHAFYGSVIVDWKITRNDSLAVEDYKQTNGNFVFAEDEKFKSFNLSVLNDATPELNETFIVSISVRAINNNKVFKDFAKVQESAFSCQVTITENDHPYGVFQIMATRPNGSVPMLREAVNLTVTEEIGTFSLYIVRAAGNEGDVSVEWRTRGFDRTNNSLGLTAIPGADFKAALGRVDFAPKQSVMEISIKVFDNEQPELFKYFQVELYNAKLSYMGVASHVNIGIAPSDNSLGTFGFPQPRYTVAEGDNVNILLLRDGGALGDVLIYWRVANGSSDFQPSDGHVMFCKDVHQRMFQIQTLLDSTSELDENFTIEIYNVTGGHISSDNSTSVVKILANDFPYGQFRFSKNRTIVEEKEYSIRLIIERKKGKFGSVRVHVAIQASKDNNTASDSVDYTMENNWVDFVEGQTEGYVNVTIHDDSTPELTEVFVVNITRVKLLNSSQAIRQESIAEAARLTTVEILANDNPNGVVEFKSSTVYVSEDHEGTFLTVVRRAGTYGKISFGFTVESQTAVLTKDFEATSLFVQMEDGQRQARLPVYVLQDREPEFDEAFTVRLLSESVTGNAGVGNLTQTQVTILANDHPYGMIGFETVASIAAEEGTQVVVKVIREGGASGVSTIRWMVNDTEDITPTTGHVEFVDGQRSQKIIINVTDDTLPEVNETFALELVNVTSGQSVIDWQRAHKNITVLLNDNPFGTVQFFLSTQTVQEPVAVPEKNVTLVVNRLGGVNGQLKVHYRTNELSLTNRALGGSDYLGVTENFVLLDEGSRQHNITVLVYQDTVPELDEVFQVELTEVELLDQPSVLPSQMPSIGHQNIINITIQRNDNPNGLFTLSLDAFSYSAAMNKHVVMEPEKGSQQLLFRIARTKGLFGRVSVSWRLGSAGNISSTDISGADGAMVVFDAKEQTKTFTVRVNSDNVPENDEYFTVELYQPSGGAQIDPEHQNVGVVILANDNVGGIVRFRNGSLSVDLREGATTRTLYLDRSLPALGCVHVRWQIMGVNASYDFLNVQGNVTFESGETSSTIVVQALADTLPEIDERFTLRLTEILTTGVSSTGQASVDTLLGSAVLTIAASDHPHGVVEFSRGVVRVGEDVGSARLLLVRQYGKIGDIEIHYQARLASANESVNQASLTEDIKLTSTKLIMANGVDSAFVYVPVVDDDISEIDEEFIVELTSAQLVSTRADVGLGTNTRKHVIIEANDGAHGKLMFASSSVNLVVEEREQTFNLTVVRSLGAFGEVHCFFFVNRLTASKPDFHVAGGVMDGGPGIIRFANLQSEAFITVTIYDDNITENCEQFEVGITTQNTVDNGGVTVGTPSRTTVTISANDGANGYFRFAKISRRVVLEEAGMAQLKVERTRGFYGQVTLGWQVQNSTSDVSPMNGVLQFDEFKHLKTFEITALDDDVPELENNFMIALTVISGGGILMNGESTSMVSIPANDRPFGEFTFSTQRVFVEESQPVVKLTVLREGGTYSRVSVAYQTVPDTAQTLPDTRQTKAKIRPFFETIWDFDEADARFILSFESSDEKFAMMFTQEKAHLFVWRGTLSLVETFDVANVTRAIALSVHNNTLLVLNTPHNIQGFAFKNDNGSISLTKKQTIAQQGVSSMDWFASAGTVYLVFVVGVDGSGDSIQRIQLYQWSNDLFTYRISGIQTFHGVSVSSIQHNKVTYLVVANRYNRLSGSHATKTNVYTWDHGNRMFTIFDQLDTQKPAHVRFIQHDNSLFVSVANEMGNCELRMLNNTNRGHFSLVKNLLPSGCTKVESLSKDDQAFLVVATSSPQKNKIFEWKENTLTELTHDFAGFTNLTRFEKVRFVDNEDYLTVFSHEKRSSVIGVTYVDNNTDFVHRGGWLDFAEGVKQLDLFVSLLPDQLPESDESFTVRLQNATAGATISNQPLVRVTIMANDNAYGRFKIADGWENLTITELDYDSAFSIQIEREFGTFGEVLVLYNITNADGTLQNKIYPNKNQIRFKGNERRMNLTFYLVGDTEPELAGEFIFRLVNTTVLDQPTSGQPEASVNAAHRQAHIHVPPNDDPHGLVGWMCPVYVTHEKLTRNSSVLLVLQRKRGAYSDITVSLTTQPAGNAGPGERMAVPGVDYTHTQQNITMVTGEREKFVFVPIMPRIMDSKANLSQNDGDSKLNEVFDVKITSAHVTSDVTSDVRVDASASLAQVVITEVVQVNGVIEFRDKHVRVSEKAGEVSLYLQRSAGKNGVVGAYFQVMTSSADDITPLNGTVTFDVNQTSAAILLRVVDDVIPELDEHFRVVLTKPMGGVELGEVDNMTLTIVQNDYPYGLFDFERDSFVHKEGDEVKITVVRSFGTFGDVEVYWSCNTTNNLTTIQHGVLDFKQNASSAHIAFDIVDDLIPELEESFDCRLTNATYGGYLGNRTGVMVTVEASDRPYGVFVVAPVSRTVVVSETGDHANVNISVLRKGGQQSVSSVSWEITGSDGIFVETSGVLMFSVGQKSSLVPLQLVDDAIPEEAHWFTLRLHSPTGGAELSPVPSAIVSRVRVTSSDNPYGTFGVVNAQTKMVDEAVGWINIAVSRVGGLIGHAYAMYNITGGNSSTPGEDFTPTSGVLSFAPGDALKVLRVYIVNDTLPELSESLTVELTKVAIVNTTVDFQEMLHGVKVNEPPSISLCCVKIVVEENDNPFGVIEFAEEEIFVNEWDGTVYLEVLRHGGLFGDVNVTFFCTSVNATRDVDFVINKTHVFFAQGANTTHIAVQLFDDQIPEGPEVFELRLVSVVSGKSQLATRTKLRVVIDTSDNLKGLFGFYHVPKTVRVKNPTVENTAVSFNLSRMDGVVGNVMVKWVIERLGGSQEAVDDDILPSGGSAMFADQQSGVVEINVSVLKHQGNEEVEERFVLRLTEASGGGRIQASSSQCFLVVEKKGHPSGLFSLVAPEVLAVQEPETGVSVVNITVVREYGLEGNIKVFWTITAVSNDSVSNDISYNEQPRVFAEGVQSQNITLSIKADQTPELDELFTIELTRAESPAEIMPSKKKMQLLIRANEDPHGVFAIDTIHLSTNDTGRFLHFSVNRTTGGRIGSVRVDVMIRYSMAFNLSAQVVFEDRQLIAQQTLDLPQSLFIYNDTFLHMQIVSVSLLSTNGTGSPNYNNTEHAVGVPEHLCNSVVTIGPQYSLSNRQGWVSVHVNRVGTYSAITVQLKSGFANNNGNDKAGDLDPTTRSFVMGQGEKETSVLFRIKNPSVADGSSYGVYIDSLTPREGQLGWSVTGGVASTVTDPHGVVRICCQTLRVTEGRSVSVKVHRLYGHQGKIRVFYETVNQSAVKGVDYLQVMAHVDFESSEYEKQIKLQTVDDAANPIAEDVKSFQLQLTGVEILSSQLVAGSPRLSDDNSSEIVIEDDDYPFGLISFESTTYNVSESNDAFAEIVVQRKYGAFVGTSVQVLSVGGGESWQSEIFMQNASIQQTADNILYKASSTTDYVPLKQTLSFPESQSAGGQKQTVRMRIWQDNVAEPAEKFILVLQNASNGTVIDSDNFVSVVTISANGLYNGEIGFETKITSVDEDAEDRTARLVVTRQGDALQDVKVTWQADYPSNQLEATGGQLTIPAGQHTATISVTLADDTTPELGGWFLMRLTALSPGAFLRTRDVTANVTVDESDGPAGVVEFHVESRYVVTELSKTFVELQISRLNASLKPIAISYTTYQPTDSISDGGVRFNPAIQGRDYQGTTASVDMLAGQTSATVKIEFTPNLASQTAYPKFFAVMLESATNGAHITQNASRVVIALEETTAKFLKLRSSLMTSQLTDPSINSLTANLLSTMRESTLTRDEQRLVVSTLEGIYNQKQTQPDGLNRMDRQSTRNVLQIYDLALDPKRTDTKGNAFWMESVERLAYHLLNGLPCSTSVSHRMTNYDLTAHRVNATAMNLLELQDGKDTFSYPSTTTTRKCSNVQFVVVKNTHLFNSPYPVLSDKVLSSESSGGLDQQQRVTFRMHPPQGERVTPVPARCVIWDYVTTNWSDAHCQMMAQDRSYVQCECQHLSDYTVIASSDMKTGYHLYFFVACFITTGACLLALLVHHCCSMEKTFSANLLMHMFFAVMVTNLLFAVAAYVSGQLTNNREACSVMAIFLHFFFLAQFTTMFVQTCNLWRILIMNDEHSYRKYIPFFLLAWGLPLFIIVCYVFITFAVWDWTFTKMYADVHSNGDMCFIAHGYAAFSSTVIPVILLVVAVGVVFIQAYQMTPQWKCYDDIYRGRYNIKEVRHLMIVFALISITWLFGGLHLAYGHLWMIVLFTFFDVLTALYILIVYVILRNQLRHVFKGEYVIRQSPTDLMELPNVAYDEKLHKFGARDYNEFNDWDNVDLTRMTPVSTSMSRARSVTPVSVMKMRETMDNGVASRSNESYEDEHFEREAMESGEFDELIYALKSGGGQSSSSVVDDDVIFENEPPPISGKRQKDRYTVRRIKMSDTHL